MAETSITTYDEEVLETPDLVRGKFRAWASSAWNKVITGAIRSFSVSGEDSDGIAEAHEVYDQTGKNSLIWREVALLLMQRGDGLHRRAVVNAVLKGHLDGPAPAGWQGWDVPISSAVWLTVQPGMRWQNVGGADPGTLHGAALELSGNPGTPSEAISGDMVVWQAGLPYREIRIDGARWGIPLVKLDTL
jgi:hypothetical protein